MRHAGRKGRGLHRHGALPRGSKFSRASQRQSNAGVWAYVHEAVALAHLDRIEEAGKAIERVHAIKPDFDMNFVVSTFEKMGFVDFEFLRDGLKKAGLRD